MENVDGICGNSNSVEVVVFGESCLEFLGIPSISPLDIGASKEDTEKDCFAGTTERLFADPVIDGWLRVTGPNSWRRLESPLESMLPLGRMLIGTDGGCTASFDAL